jgi:N-acetylneuraminate synthase/N,N'-diacetyllegionaminate synthase
MSTQKVLIIAEAGVNHNGDLEKAAELIKVASAAGADFVKFQTFKAENIVSRKAKKAAYQIQNMQDNESLQFNMLKNLELDDDAHHFLIEECKKHDIAFLSTAFDVEGIDYLETLGLSIFKSPSGEITNRPYLERIASLGKPIILSTGMASFVEVEAAIQVLNENGVKKNNITVLHCNTEYPTPMKDVNLHAMNWMSKKLGVSVGYSDHTLGIEVPIAATALGAKVIEKHFTLDRTLPGPDHKASLEPDELKSMVLGIRNIELAISGDGIKNPTESEKRNIEIARKSIHAKRDLVIGQIISENDLIPLRPGSGISPMEWNKVVGKRVTKPCNAFELLTWDMFE